MIAKISDFLSRNAKSRLIFVSFLVMVIMMSYFLPSAQARLEASGGGPIDLMMFPAPTAVLAGISALSEEGRAYYLLVELTYDLIYPLAYTFFYGLSLSVLLKQIAPPNSPYQRLNVLPVAAFFFDILENIGIISLLATYPTQSAALAGFVSLVNSLKWVFALSSMAALVVALAFWVVHKFFRKR